MHPRNPYRTPPDFVVLAEVYLPLRPFLIQTAEGVSIDFQDQGAQRCLTQALLYRDFGITLDLPADRLCPPVPNRLNYILWLQDIMSASRCMLRPDSEVIRGVDIGTGASAIYPLLGCVNNSTWHFFATELDEKSIEFARRNVSSNSLENQIDILQAPSNGSILPAKAIEAVGGVDFTMCNPPFYSDREEVLASAEAKEQGPSAVCTGADTEMITPGGEVAFVGKMVRESLELGTRCRWYTSMLGKMSSLTDIVGLLKINKIDNYAITEFVQGRTRRWAIAWSFDDLRLPDSLARIANPALQTIMPARNTMRQAFTRFGSKVDLERSLAHVLQSIDGVQIMSHYGGDEGGTLVRATHNTWSRAARRRKVVTSDAAGEASQAGPGLYCKVRCQDEHSGSKPHSYILEFDWVCGKDRVLFESFTSHVTRKVETLAKTSDVDMAQ